MLVNSVFSVISTESMVKRFSQNKLVDLVRCLRKQHGLTQAQLAGATDINRTMIGRIENGDYVPTVN